MRAESTDEAGAWGWVVPFLTEEVWRQPIFGQFFIPEWRDLVHSGRHLEPHFMWFTYSFINFKKKTYRIITNSLYSLLGYPGMAGTVPELICIVPGKAKFVPWAP